ncbi:MAG: hypothetical protein FIA99_17250, partial [Ruminiclostridium sp.]|nr:hypothetical protein [Ruminiclostridium sp.]
MGVNKDSGQITVFLSIILLSVIILAGVLVDASRVSSGESLVRSAVSSAARSVLAGYGSRLKESYGLFAFDAANEEELEDTVKYYLEKNLQIDGNGAVAGASIDLYGFRIESINVSAVQNLSENKAFKHQILEYMKYRAPKELVEGFVERLKAFRDMGRMSAAYSKKVSLDKIMGRLDKSQQSLKRYVDGAGKDTDRYINGFNLNGVWQQAFNDYLNRNSDLKATGEELGRLEGELGELQQESISTGLSGQESDGVPDPQDRINFLTNERNILVDRIAGLNSSINETWKNLRYSLTDEYTAPNEKAVRDIDKIIEAGKNAEELISGLESFLKSGFTGNGDFVMNLGEDLNRIKGLLLTGQQAAGLLKSLGNNKQILDQLVEKLDMLKSRSIGGNGSLMDSGGMMDDIRKLVSEYDNHIEYSYEKPDKGNKADDPRKDKAG